MCLRVQEYIWGWKCFSQIAAVTSLGVLLVLFSGFECPADGFGKRSVSETDLMEWSLEDLMAVEIISAGKKSQKMFEVSAAIFVITQEDIRRSGVTSIPEALRMVPGLQVARIDANKWAISSRGFNDRFANKLLVLIDGRSVYEPLFSGVLWNVQDTMLEDIDRIEVIRGPGATLWGANAVNGVINIITKSAYDTQGGLITGGAGNEERGFGAARYGGKLGEKGAYRIYAKYFDRDGSVDADGNDTYDDWQSSRAGFRTDWAFSAGNRLTIQGDLYDGDYNEKGEVPIFDTPPFYESLEYDATFSGGNLLARWERVFTDSSEMSLQVYYDRTEIDEIMTAQNRDTVDIDLQHRFTVGERQELIWGLGYRVTSNKLCSRYWVGFEHDRRRDQLFSGFVQDDISLITDNLRLTLGSKFEHNDYTGFEVQPNGRLLWTPSDNHSVWCAVSRAVRTPSQYEEEVQTIPLVMTVPTAPGMPALPVGISISGDTDFTSEDLLATEVGYRFQPMTQLSLDLTAFYNVYENLQTMESGSLTVSPGAPTPLIVPTVFDNKMDGETYGFEMAADWNPLDWCRFQLAYTFLKVDFDTEHDSSFTTAGEESSPEQQVSLRSSINLPQNLELDLWLRYVDTIVVQDLSINDYLTLDFRMGWKPRKNLELSIVAQNLFDDRHPEFVDPSTALEVTEVERSVYGKITWRF